MIHYAEANETRPAFLTLEWIDQVQPSRAFAEKFGRALAALHRHTAQTFGIDYDSVIDGLPQPSKPRSQSTSWPAF